MRMRADVGSLAKCCFRVHCSRRDSPASDYKSVLTSDNVIKAGYFVYGGIERIEEV